MQHVPLAELRGQFVAQLLNGGVDGVLVAGIGWLVLVGLLLVVGSLADTEVTGDVVIRGFLGLVVTEVEVNLRLLGGVLLAEVSEVNVDLVVLLLGLVRG